MKSTGSDQHFYVSHPPILQNFEDDDILSLVSLNIEPTLAINYLSDNINAFVNQRLLSKKRSVNSIVHHNSSNGNGIIINGSLFDEQLFQPNCSSFIMDYANTSQDLNTLLQDGNAETSTCAQLESNLFKLAFVMTLTDWHADKEHLLGYCPRKDNNDDILKEFSYYKRFCFPELKSGEKYQKEIINDQSTYVFTRTWSSGQMEYGYCRRLNKNQNKTTNFPIVFCIVSTHQYFKLYDAILNELIATYMSNELECNLLMESFYSKPLPKPTKTSSGITCILNKHRIFFYLCPRDDRLNHDYFSTLLSCLSANNIVHLFESILYSKRILIFSRYPSKLTKSCLALIHLIYPFIWSYSFVSLMPSLWIHDLLDSPFPFIYGCLYETMERISSIVDDDTILVDLDLNRIDDNSENKHILPVNLRQTLESSLEYIGKFRLMKLNSILINIGISEACLQVFTELFYRLPDFFKRQKHSNFSICKNYFQFQDNEIDFQSLTSNDSQKTNRFDYEFRSNDFLSAQSEPSYATFLNEFIHEMMFFKFLDDYQHDEDNKKEMFSLFNQRLSERRQMTLDDLSIDPFLRFRHTFDLLEKQIKQSSKRSNSSFSKYVKKIFQ